MSVVLCNEKTFDPYAANGAKRLSTAHMPYRASKLLERISEKCNKAVVLGDVNINWAGKNTKELKA